LVYEEADQHSHYEPCYQNNENTKEQCIPRGVVPFGVVVQFCWYIHRCMEKVIKPIIGGGTNEQG
jgi:hypothetical protein